MVRITRAVIVQTTMVSMNTSQMPQSPWPTGVFCACAWTIEAEPRPASLEKMPRALP